LRLTLFRHAKSAWPDAGLDDFDRPLNKRGRDAAVTMAHAMISAGITPSLLLCSAARRARETLAGALPILRGDCRIAIEHGLYLASADALLDRLHAITGDDTEILVIGHNPGLHELALMLTEPAQSDAYRNLTAKFPTAALAELEFRTGNWSEVKRGQGKLRRFMTPRSLADTD
jgi:phosphohistidine phosphatase